jgi:Ser/Thr protein kinase RdoA (MazF antagonist)
MRDRVHAEIAFTSHLETQKFTHYPALLRTLDGSPHFEEPNGLIWTAYEYIEGGPVAPEEPTGPALMGHILADLHQLSAPPDPGPSRLATFPELSNEVRWLVPSAAVRRATSIVLEALSDLTELRRSCVHGDFNSQNVILRAGEPMLIDLEFARWDVRLLDFASLVAPWRLASGRFWPDPSFAAGVARAYGSRGHPVGGLDARERELFPTAALAHTLFMVRDLSLAGNVHAVHAHTLLLHQLDHPPSV